MMRESAEQEQPMIFRGPDGRTKGTLMCPGPGEVLARIV